MLVNFTRRSSILLTQRSCYTDNFSHHTCSTHYADCSQRHVSHTNITSCHKQVLYISGVQAAIGYCIRIYIDVVGCCFEFRIRELLRIIRIGKMQVNTPCSRERGIFVKNVLINIILFQNIVSQQSAGFSFSGNIGHPSQ